MDVESLAGVMLAECVEVGQSARRVDTAEATSGLRSALRSGARAAGIRVRTAVVDGVVVIARTDAALWSDDTATMRRKLQPPD